MPKKSVKAVVIYTHNVSRAIRVHELPQPGETVRSIGYSSGVDGAKGTNVALALGRLGVPTALVANARRGDWNEQGRAFLREAGVDGSFVREYDDPTYSRGAMFIDDHGNNMIVLSSGRQFIPPELISDALDSFKDAQFCVTGYELGAEGAEEAVIEAHRRGLKTLVNPSPVPSSLPDCWDKVDVLVLNEHELAALLGERDAASGPEWAAKALRRLRSGCGCRSVVLTLGAAGYMLLDGGEVFSGPGMKVENVVDTSGAGDGFLASLTAGLACGRSLESACAWANAYSALTVCREGTISAYPWLGEAEASAGRLCCE